MAEYIDRDATVKAFNNFDAGRADNPPFTLLTPEEFAEYLYEIPTADVAPVVHGRWENGDPICPVCGKDKFKDLDADIWCDWKPDYCPNCGAKMDKQNESEN